MTQQTDAPAIDDLLESLAQDTGELVRQQLQLAAAEMAGKARLAARTAPVAIAGGALLQLGLAGVLASIPIGLEMFVPLWASSLVVGVIVLATGYALIRRSLRALDHLGPASEQALATARSEDTRFREPLR